MIVAESRAWLFATLGLEVELAASDDDGLGTGATMMRVEG